MPVYNFAFPVVPGKEGLARQFAAEAVGDHAEHYSSLMNASGTTRVTWMLDRTPVGTLILVWFEAGDVTAIFDILATSSGEDARWMRSHIEEVGGVDMTVPPPGPPPELILEWPR